MSKHLFLLLNSLVLRSSLPLPGLRRDNLRKKKCTISSGACLLKSKWKWGVPSQLFHRCFLATSHSAHRCCSTWPWRASVLIWNEKAQHGMFLLLQIQKKRWFIWERQRDATSISGRGSGAGRSHQIRLKPALGGGRDCCFNWKQKQLGCSTRSQVKH